MFKNNQVESMEVLGQGATPLKTVYIKYISSLILFGSNGIVASLIPFSSVQIVFLRSALGTVFLLTMFFISGKKLTAFRTKRDFWFITVSGIAMAIEWLCLFEAYARIGVGLGVIINYTGPAIVVASSPIVFKEKITVQKIFALICALVGAILISGQATATGISTSGLVCAGFSAVLYAVMVISNKMAKQAKGTENATLQLLVAVVVITVFAGFRGEFGMHITYSNILPIICIGLINTGIGCYLYFSSIGSLSSQSVAVCGYIEPLSAVLFSAVFLKERLLPLQIVGAVLIVGGAVFGERKNISSTHKNFKTV